MGTHGEDGALVQEQEHKSKHKSKDRDREKKEKRDKKDKSGKASRHGRESRDIGAAADHPLGTADGTAEKEAVAPANGRLPTPEAQAPVQHEPAELPHAKPAVAPRPADRRADPVINDSGGEVSMSVEETNRCVQCIPCMPHSLK